MEDLKEIYIFATSLIYFIAMSCLGGGPRGRCHWTTK